jgi:hypothetical protein
MSWAGRGSTVEAAGSWCANGRGAKIAARAIQETVENLDRWCSGAAHEADVLPGMADSADRLGALLRSCSMPPTPTPLRVSDLQ